MAPLLHASSSPPGPGAHGGPGPSRGTLLRCHAAPSTPCPRNPLRLPASQGRVRSRTSPQSAQGPHPAYGLTHTSTLMSSNPVPRLRFPTRLAWGTPSLETPAGRAKGCPRLAHSEAWLLRPPEPPTPSRARNAGIEHPGTGSERGAKLLLSGGLPLESRHDSERGHQRTRATARRRWPGDTQGSGTRRAGSQPPGPARVRPCGHHPGPHPACDGR